MTIHFTCPYCSTTTEVADQYLGQTGPCKSCGKSITIPMASEKVAPTPTPDSGKSIGCTLLVITAVTLGVLVVGGALLAAFLLPAVNSARESARRVQCSNNLQQLSLAMNNYHAAHGTFPPAYLADEDGNPAHSWRVLILPFIGEDALYEQYSFDEPWDGPNNQLLSAQMPSQFNCPADDAVQPYVTNYFVVVGDETMFPGNKAMKMADITDGTSKTLMLVEVPDNEIHWLEPRDIEAIEMINQATPTTHPGGFNAALADGSVQFISTDSAAQTLPAMSTAAGND